MGIEERVEKLEQELKRQKMRSKRLLVAVALLAFTAVLSFVLMGPLGGAQAQGDGQVVAKEIVLVDDEGNVRLRLGALQDQPGLALLGRDGSALAVFAAHSDGSFLILNNSRGKTRVILSVDSDGAGLNIFDDSDVVRAAMAHMNENPAPDLNLYDSKGEIIWSAFGK